MLCVKAKNKSERIGENTTIATTDKIIYETLLGYVLDLKNNNFNLSNFEINKIMEMEHYLKKLLEIKTLKK